MGICIHLDVCMYMSAFRLHEHAWLHAAWPRLSCCLSGHGRGLDGQCGMHALLHKQGVVRGSMLQLPKAMACFCVLRHQPINQTPPSHPQPLPRMLVGILGTASSQGPLIFALNFWM